MKTVIAIRHMLFEHLDAFDSILTANGFSIRYLDAGVHDLADAVDADLMILLGGPIGACDENEFPFVLDELRIIEKRIQRQQPLLGICLGAQMMARALGATLHSGTAHELGWLPLTLTPTGMDSALRFLGDGNLVFQWHSDTFDLPAGAVHLARSKTCENQAFAYGSNALALQFHPEVSAENLERWYIGFARALQTNEGSSVQQLRAQGHRHAPDLSKRAKEFLQNWLEQITLLD